MAYDQLTKFANDGYLLHGSPKKLERLKGKPLFATSLAEYALLMACIPFDRGYNRGAMPIKMSEDGRSILLAPDLYKRLTNGYTYVLPKGPFKLGKDKKEWTTREEVQPVDCVEVTPQDMPVPIIEERAFSVRGFDRTRIPLNTRKGFRPGRAWK